MSAYFSELHRWPEASGFFAGVEHAHLTADTDEELHELAVRIGLRPASARVRRGVPCYELTLGRRDAARREGASFMCEVEQLARRVGIGRVAT